MEGGDGELRNIGGGPQALLYWLGWPGGHTAYDSSWLVLSRYLHQAELRLASVRTARCLVSSKQQVQPQRCNALSLSQSRAGVWGPGCGNLSVFPALG